MADKLHKTLDFLVSGGIAKHLSNLQRGLEKESLRVDPNGLLAQTPHPDKLGSAFTHPMITTDYSESLLEFVTPVHNDINELLNQLYDIHHFTYQHIDQEKLWVNSMPCIVESEETIPIARYGKSNVAKMKEAYRTGLSYRYGSLMQTIAGIHFNFSLPDAFWTDITDTDSARILQDYKSDRYFSLIRNFHRYSWIISYLFGASPAVCKTFLKGREHMLEDFDAYSFFAPQATSLRLSGLGYSNDAQGNIEICYNSVDDFVKSLRNAIQTPNPRYEKFGIKVAGEYRQLNSNLLQIENEFYSSIRPKRIAASGESPARALQEKGVQYIEVRSIDLNPFVPIGIDDEIIHFLDTLLLFCMFSESDQLSAEEFNMTKERQKQVVMAGRDSNLKIDTTRGEKLAKNEMNGLLGQLQSVAELLDQENNTSLYMSSLNSQLEKVADSGLTPSAKIISEMRNKDMSFFEFSMMMSEKSEAIFKQKQLEPSVNQRFEQLAIASHAKQLVIEKNETIDFDEFIADYFDRQNAA